MYDRRMRPLVLVVILLGCASSCSSKEAPSREPLITEPTVNDGMRITYAVAPEALDGAVVVVRKRIAHAGIKARAQVAGERLIVDLAARDMDEAQAARDLIARVGRLDVGTEDDRRILSNDAVARARVDSDAQTGMPLVILELTDRGRADFAALTRRIVGAKLVIAVDDEVLVSPVVREEIPGGRLWITMPSTLADPRAAAAELATVLRSGPLPAPLAEESVSLLRDGKVAQEN